MAENNQETMQTISERVARVSTDFERNNSDLKRRYFIWNIEAFNTIVSKVKGFRGSFGTGYPFYALDSRLEGTLPIIQEQIRYNRKLVKDGETYIFDKNQILSNDNGNYLLISTFYGGEDTGVNYNTDDETVGAVVKLGIYTNGKFEEKYKYDLTVREGRNDYLIRVSCDYNWYLGEINAVQISSGGMLQNTEMKILEGD